MSNAAKNPEFNRYSRKLAQPRRREFRRWLAPAGTALAAATLLAACGGGSSSSGAAGPSGGSQPQSAGGSVVSLHDQSGIGMTLVDSAGKTLYFSDEEKAGTSSCTSACLGFWFPLTVRSKSISTPQGLTGKLSTVKRSDDGKLQVAFNGAPLYTFKLDAAAGDAKGNDFSDAFGSTHFTWHAASTTKAVGTTTPATSPSTMNNGGYGNY